MLMLVAWGSSASAQNLAEVVAPNLGGKCDDLDLNALAAAIDVEVAALAKKPASDRYQIGSLLVPGTVDAFANLAANDLPSSTFGPA